jgi:hypothetical protein
MKTKRKKKQSAPPKRHDVVPVRREILTLLLGRQQEFLDVRQTLQNDEFTPDNLAEIEAALVNVHYGLSVIPNEADDVRQVFVGRLENMTATLNAAEHRIDELTRMVLQWASVCARIRGDRLTSSMTAARSHIEAVIGAAQAEHHEQTSKKLFREAKQHFPD